MTPLSLGTPTGPYIERPQEHMSADMLEQEIRISRDDPEPGASLYDTLDWLEHASRYTRRPIMVKLTLDEAPHLGFATVAVVRCGPDSNVPDRLIFDLLPDTTEYDRLHDEYPQNERNNHVTTVFQFLRRQVARRPPLPDTALPSTRRTLRGRRGLQHPIPPVRRGPRRGRPGDRRSMALANLGDRV